MRMTLRNPYNYGQPIEVDVPRWRIGCARRSGWATKREVEAVYRTYNTDEPSSEIHWYAPGTMMNKSWFGDDN